MKHENRLPGEKLNATLPLALPPLAFDPGAMGSAISAETFKYHHEHHHKAYIDKVNELAAEANHGANNLEELIFEVRKDKKQRVLLNNALQAWNHSFQWLSLAEISDVNEFERINILLETSFGSMDDMVAEAVKMAKAHFGSGWLWLIANDDGLEMITTHDAERPENPNAALLVLDLWEHAYYLDHQNRKEQYVESVVRNHWNWAFAEERLQMKSAE
jgi:superoxide dismutase, Fe-Mn family